MDYALEDAKHLIKEYKEAFPENIVYIWTGHTFDEALKRLGEYVKYVDFLITEPFIEALKCECYLRRFK